ncbi:hypothetical protein LTR91_022523 [Friedmanniomyces endolithicus]|uniref:Uncharacterized protein n=1 Tax=Friedmanniomyces endolithicus TaxID=329885 RepID=A0AAN6H5U5_9PEZI|nr:hypothetical protein LTS09_010046 [Friedmanniomyces endolithicus]KAK0266677.1 hypothetical protein LTR35_016916 [Friedmanniomyces endolithicus]KAK0272409.1 hypothetical protein LTS00_016248 [Friedmanniomyces endolithicus]KAK0303797.1 hypothetical protein LTR01_007883 [Friedmanniomyces endolithicus]KAK0314037.1 hypothetical protein LTR82_013347 [Friedmanniomyces endolithicus]
MSYIALGEDFPKFVAAVTDLSATPMPLTSFGKGTRRDDGQFPRTSGQSVG